MNDCLLLQIILDALVEKITATAPLRSASFGAAIYRDAADLHLSIAVQNAALLHLDDNYWIRLLIMLVSQNHCH